MSTSVSSTGLTSPSGHPFRMPAVNSRAKTTQLLENLVASDREVLGTDRSPSLGESSDDVSAASGTEEDPIMLPEESSAGSQSQPRSSSDSAASFASSGSSKAMLAPAKPTRSDFPILKASCLVLMMRTATQATAIPTLPSRLPQAQSPKGSGFKCNASRSPKTKGKKTQKQRWRSELTPARRLPQL
ncbi:hypothetical protein L917_05355 [Phytophthora nicotianae]|uniref:Uncharacterized protein n=2 Tax=Phytophthora nicotianae TaxID=4792 RepID=W2LIS1_PHYNI|nr:hypothetical protein L917_05355 [Phytophthora nicotianae]